MLLAKHTSQKGEWCVEPAQGWRDGKRAEWKGYDPRFMTAINMIKDGVFGDKEYFQVQPCHWTCSTLCRYSPRSVCASAFPPTRRAMHCASICA